MTVTGLERGTATALREWADAVRESELERARGRLESQGDLTPAQRRTLAAFSEALVDGVLDDAESALTTATRRDDAETAARICDLFDVER
jgi:glutamyl-tRNA reductase